MATRLNPATAYQRAAERLNPKTLVDNIKTDATALTRDIPALAKEEIKPSAKHAGIGGGMFGGAGYLAANAASLFFLAGAAGIAALFNTYLDWTILASAAIGGVIMAVILLLIAAILGMIGKKHIEQVQPPKATIAETKQTIEAIKGSLSKGVQQVNTDARDRKAVVETKRAAKDLDDLN